MSPGTWQRIKSLYAEAKELPVERRPSFLAASQITQPRESAEVIRLLRLDGHAEQTLETLKPPFGLLSSVMEGRSFFAGQRLANRYEIIRFLASGGMGEVYEAHDLHRLERIAIKTVRPDLAQEEHLSWLRREVESAKRIQHPNICRVYDLVQADGATFLTMELLVGETLAAYLAKHGSLSERQALPWLRQILAGLGAAHRAGVIHRDFKPGNVMVVPRVNASPRLVVMDFGLARHTSHESYASYTSQTWSMAAGTPVYMAPEQILGQRTSSATDIYAFGLVLFEMLTGELPYASESPLNMAVRKTQEEPPSVLNLVPTLRRSWASVIRRCLAPKPADRFSSVDEILPALDSRSTQVWWSKLLIRKVKRMALLRAPVVAGLIALVMLTAVGWQVWPRQAAPDAQQMWERGIQGLHADEPLVALQAFEKAVALGNPPWRIHADLALAWQGLGVPSRAEAQLAGMDSLFRPAQEIEYKKAVAAWIGGEKPRAIEILSGLAQAHPNDVQALADLAWFSNGPIERWRRVAKLKPAYGAAHFHLGDLAAKAGKWREAENEFLLAQSHFEWQKLEALSRSVAARRGQRRLEEGEVELAMRDLSGFAKIPSAMGVGTCEHALVLMAGVADNFALPGEKIELVSPKLQQLPLLAGRKMSRSFDEDASNEEQFFSLPLPPYRICAAKLECKIRRSRNPSGSDNDSMIIGAAPFATGSPIERMMLWVDSPTLSERTLSIELSPMIFQHVFSVYADQRQAFIDFLIGDDTIFDYVKLTLFY